MSLLEEFLLNGRRYQISQPINLSALLYYFDYKETLFVLEYNNFICDQKYWHKITIKKNDKIEIITIVGGG